MKLQKLLILLLALISPFCGTAGVVFQFSAGSIDSGTLKTKMENNISALLTEIDRAGSQGTPLNLSSIDMETSAKARLNALWDEASHFVCDRKTNISRCLNDYQGYQVRAIPITMKPIDSSYAQSINRELTISLNKNGVITGVRPAWELQEDVSKIMQDAMGVADTRMRREILKWVEDFRCYYNEKNLKALNQIYSDDALIITGSVVNQRKMHGDTGLRLDPKVNYTVQSKKQYLEKLSNIFNSNKRIEVKFDHISVIRHGAKENIYGVVLHQDWKTNTYMDSGWLFLIWNFSDPERPQILVRTWQHNDVHEDEIFSLSDFKL